ncbi:MAG TPA: phytanoyl-CoA dioxygenase family protein [Thermoanaerobaculia bacterium]|nr:phytanoyl-CoA dioxygenase family protein [Thermoanaerobaculia bacterium]
MRIPTAEERERFERQGHLTLRAVLDRSEVAAWAELVRGAAAASEPLAPTDQEGEVYRRAFTQYTNLWRIEPRLRGLVCSPRLAGLAADLLGVERVRLYHDQALFKAPGGGHTPWHQDQAYWPLDTDRVLTLWLPLVAATPDMGGLRFANGSHREGSLLADAPISAGSEALAERVIAERGYQIESTGWMAAGDASLHAGWTLHAAGANNTDRERQVMTVIWFADGARLCEPRNEGQRNDLAAWFPGLRPGDLAASELNPLA